MVRVSAGSCGAFWLILCGVVSAQIITEFPVPGSGPIVSGPDGNLYTSNAVVSTAGTVVRSITLNGSLCIPSQGLASSPMGGLAFDPGGTYWYTSRCPLPMWPLFPLPEPPFLASSAGDVYLAPMFPVLLWTAAGLWLAGVPGEGVWHMSSPGNFDKTALPASSDQDGSNTALGLAADGDGNVWYSRSGTNRVGRISTSGAITEFDLPSSDRQARAMTRGPDGNVWFLETSGDGSRSWIARSTPLGQVTEFATPSPVGPGGQIAAGPDGNLWFTVPFVGEALLDRLGRVTPGGSITEFVTPTPRSGPAGITAGSDGNVWLTEWGIGKIGRVNVGLAGRCSPTALCLDRDRFSVSASHHPTPAGPAQPAIAVPLTGDTGYFWFFAPDNVELVVKVLDGCSINGEHWVFAGGLTNVGVDWTVTDLQTGTSRTYSNAAGTPLQPIQDSSAFPCP